MSKLSLLDKLIKDNSAETDAGTIEYKKGVEYTPNVVLEKLLSYRKEHQMFNHLFESFLDDYCEYRIVKSSQGFEGKKEVVQD